MKFNEFYYSFDAQPYLKKNEKEQKKKMTFTVDHNKKQVAILQYTSILAKTTAKFKKH